jgi:hypothetical protein
LPAWAMAAAGMARVNARATKPVFKLLILEFLQ